MTTETKPATDEDIEAMRSSHGIDLADFQQRIGPLIARIDAERARAVKVEANAALLIRNMKEAAGDNNHLAAQLAEARQQIAALREALRPALALVETLWIDEEERNSAALAQTEGAEG